MIPGPQHSQEAKRLTALQGYGVLDTPAEKAYDDLTALAAMFCGTSMAAISLVDRSRQWFKAKVGLDVSETPRDISFCGHTITGEGLLEVSDARMDQRFHDNPLVINEPNLRFYAGAPLLTPAGMAVGTLCVLDSKPRALSNEQKQLLRTLADCIVSQLELRVALKASRANEELLEGRVRERTSALDKALEVARAASLAKSQFFTNITHEMRTPLHSVLAFADLGIKQAKIANEERLARYFANIHAMGERQLGLVTNLLDLGRLNSRNAALNATITEFGQVAVPVLEELDPVAAAKGITIALVPSAVRCRGRFDIPQIQAVLRNLVANAIKFSAAGSRIVVDASSGENEFEGHVIDQGVGIPEDEIEHIFGPFEQSSRTCTGAGGTGLGLAISRKIIYVHGGELTARNNVNGGATFSFHIPHSGSALQKTDAVQGSPDRSVQL